MTQYSIRNEEQPIPITNNLPPIVDLVVDDFRERKTKGIERYGKPLQPMNGRDPLIDLYQELLDSVVYCRQLIYEKYGE